MFGAYLRTADGEAYTAAFSLGYNRGSPAVYANDGSTGITWPSGDLALKTSFDGTGTLRERGEWLPYRTSPFTLEKPGTATLWIRFNYVNNNAMPTRWQVDDVFIEPYNTPVDVLVGTKLQVGMPLVYHSLARCLEIVAMTTDT